MRVGLASSSIELVADQDEDLVAHALSERGVAADVVDWRSTDADWSSYDAVVIRSTWDYTEHLEDFVAWARAVEDGGTALFNSAEVVRWNTHKGYLIELEERGAPIVPTAWLGAGDEVALAAIAEDRGWQGVVAKPAVGAGAQGLLVVRPGEDPADQQAVFSRLVRAGDAMVQPFVPSVASGELSVVVIDGEVSHAVRKVPADDDVRVQIEFGARYEPTAVPDAAGGLAAWLVEVTGHDLLYARADLLADDDGSWMLLELEAVEPALLLAWSDGGAGRLADAIVRRIG